MKRFITALSVLLLLATLMSCLKPDPIEDDTSIEITYLDLMETIGFARDVVVHESKVFVAASQAGNQIWDVSGDEPVKVFQHNFTSKPALRVAVEPESRLFFTFDRAQIYFKLLNQEFTAFDPVYDIHGVQIETAENSGLIGSGSNEDMIARQLNDSLVALYVIDRTSDDGFKQYYFNHQTHEPDMIYDQEFQYWEPNNVGTSTGGINLGMDMRDSLVAIAHDELGLGLYRLDVVELDTLSVIDTPGETMEVQFYKNYLLSANNMAGMSVFALGEDNNSLTHLADIEVSGWVKQISIWNDIAILSCGENGIFLVDLSDPEYPRVDQAIDAGYTYRTVVANDIIYAATREGVKRYQIADR